MSSDSVDRGGLEAESPALVEETSFQVPATTTRRAGEFGVDVLMALFCLMSLFPPSGEYFLPWLTTLFGALASLHFFRRVFDPRPRLVVDDEGILDRTAILGGELKIPWAGVLAISTSAVRNTVELTVRDASRLRSRSRFWRGLGMRLDRLVGKRTISINPTLLGFNKAMLKERLDDGLLRFERRQLGLERSPQLSPGATEDGVGRGA